MQSFFENDVIQDTRIQNPLSALNTLLNSTDLVIDQLEVIFNEPVKTRVLNQCISKTGNKHWHKIESDEPVLSRKVVLYGAFTKKKFLYASSLIRLNNFDSEIANDLMSAKMAIGSIIKKNKLRTQRDLIRIKNIKNDLINIILDNKDEIISRTYQIMVKEKPSMFITEYYPINLYQIEE